MTVNELITKLIAFNQDKEVAADTDEGMRDIRDVVLDVDEDDKELVLLELE